ncbi:transposase [Bradyrhizobium elkanii]|jgi:transposase|nr:transposase [Bradyrhizobium elkanii]MCS3475076.1 transposase [Bradyrhizobium elkanii]MCS3521085.1 transposase [Bradyrhizobium elkanii]MCS4068740.1 transposase [Bradyrhizobium elkanii]MCS4084274.1 transposase [Bradyrhizobium elkanii]
MTWTEITRCQHDGRELRYASDCTDAEWDLLELLMPRPSKVGQPRTTWMRSVWDASGTLRRRDANGRYCRRIFLPSRRCSTTFCGLRDSGALDLINEALVEIARRLAGREPQPTAAIIDSQSVKTTESGGHAALMRARRSKVASATSSPIHKEIC